MPNPYPNSMDLPGKSNRATSICRDVLRAGGLIPTEINDVISNNASAIANVAASQWQELWLDRGDADTPASILASWKASITTWAQANLVP